MCLGVLGLILGGACTPGPAAPGPAGGAADDTGTSGTLPDVALEEPAPTWSAAEVEAHLQATLALGLPAPATPRDAYLALMAAGDEVCPGDSHQILDTYLQGCTATSGVWYAGISEWIEEHQDLVFGKGSFRLDLWALLGDFEIVDAEGQQFHSGGHVAAWTGQTETSRFWGGEIAGTWLWEGHEGWLSEEVSASLSYDGYQFGEHPRTLTAQGGVTWHGTSLHFDELVFSEACPDHPGGVLSVRDPVGSWHRLELTECEPCAEVVFAEGEVLGEACLDFGDAVEAVYEELERSWEHQE